MNNIDRFNKTTLALFKQLHERFPKRIMIDAAKVRMAAGIPAATEGEIEEAAECVLWLRKEGFIDYSSEAGGRMFANVALTAKGLDALNRVPDALSPQMTIGERLKELSVTASTEVATFLVQAALRSQMG